MSNSFEDRHYKKNSSILKTWMLVPCHCLLETSNFFETQINQTTTKANTRHLKYKFLHWGGDSIEQYYVFERPVYRQGNRYNTFVHLSHVDACSYIPLSMSVTQLCNGGYWVEPCILCQCGWYHLQGIGKSSVNTTDKIVVCWIYMMK